MSQLEILEQQITELDNDSFVKLRAWFVEFEKKRLEDAYWAEQAELALKTGFAGADKTLSRLTSYFDWQAKR